MAAWAYTCIYISKLSNSAVAAAAGTVPEPELAISAETPESGRAS